MEIRQATPADANQIVPLFRQILEEMELPILKQVETSRLTHALTQAFAQPQLCQTNATIYVACERDQVVGLAFGYQAQNADKVDRLLCAFLPEYRSLYVDDDGTLPADEWYLDSLIVKPAFRKRGIAKKLLQTCQRHTHAVGAKRLGLDVDCANIIAQKVYRHFGFIRQGIQEIAYRKYYHLQIK